ncbi:hypothetical protein [Agriterribacter sp.]|uniref:hypothetical protein n=1 Tax=Agriterribacter sp. TaxID=2821509 RepID=UPI002C85B44A|nr:hypothetical protein [Agriterribacter sp.]HTN05573.1 hypothetical protein [Agriterribacter sp.]
MKKLLLLGFTCALFFIMSARAQVIEKKVPFPTKSPQIAVNVQGTYNGFSYPATGGIGLDIKLMLNAQQNTDAYNQYVFTVKGTHTIATDGPLWGSFDDGKFNNVSAIILMAGYRFNFGAPRYLHQDFKRETGGWFLEFGGGGAHYRYSKTKLRPVISTTVGCAVAPHLDIIGSYTYSGTWLTSERKFPLAVFGMGVQYKL